MLNSDFIDGEKENELYKLRKKKIENVIGERRENEMNNCNSAVHSI